MITPSFALTATERVLPRLALDFTTASLDPRVTFTRTGNTATVINSSGQIAMINADLPRFDYNLNTGGTCKGLLIEESRTNVLPYSNPNAATPTGWSIGFNTGGVRELVACTFVPFAFAHNAIKHTVASGRSYQTASFAVVIGTTYTVSFYVDKANSSVNGGAICTVTGGGSLSLFLGNADANGLITGSFTATGISAEVRLGIGCTGNFTGVLFYTAWQMETGAFPTSYIPTEASAVTRNADTAVMTSTNFSSWYNATEGTFVISGQRVFTGNFPGFPWLFSVNDNTANNQMGVLGSGSTTTVFPGMKAAGADQLSFVTGNWNANPRKVALAYKQNSTQFAFNATASATDTSCLVPSVSRMSIGNNLGASFWSGTYAYLYYYPQRLTSSELAAFTK